VEFERNSELVKIGAMGFTDSPIRSIVIPRRVKTLEELCFWDCIFLREVRFESGSELCEIGYGAFECCAIEKICIPSKVVTIPERCFFDCKSLREVTLESKSELRKIKVCAFVHTDLPIKFLAAEERYYPDIVYDSVLISPDGERAVHYLGCDELVRIGKDVKCIGESCFWNSRTIQEITFEKDSQLERIESRGFGFSSLRRIRIPRAVEWIGEKCFWRCLSLCEMDFEEDSRLRVIGEYAFADTALRCVSIPRSVKRIENHCFCGNESLTEVVFEEGCRLEELGFCAFTGVGLEEISVPMIGVSESPSDPSESSCPSSISRIDHWRWMREHEEKPTVIIVSPEKEIPSTLNESSQQPQTEGFPSEPSPVPLPVREEEALRGRRSPKIAPPRKKRNCCCWNRFSCRTIEPE
jgi:hypothetical protein